MKKQYLNALCGAAFALLGTMAAQAYDFEVDGTHYVLNGLGHQWNTVHGNIARMNLLLATYGNSSLTWVMEGYESQIKPNENWLKYVANNAVKTRLIKCIKTPIEYIYD